MYLSAVRHFYIQAGYVVLVPNNTLFAVGFPWYTEIAKDFPLGITSAPDHIASPQEFEDVTAPMASAVPER